VVEIIKYLDLWVDTGGRRSTHWPEAQGQVVLWYLEVVGPHKGLEGTTTMAACIAHQAKRSIRIVGGTVRTFSSREEGEKSFAGHLQTPEEVKRGGTEPARAATVTNQPDRPTCTSRSPNPISQRARFLTPS
jgi:hypothetical protein